MIPRVIRFWNQEHSLTALLVILIVQLFILGPTMGRGLVVKLASDLALSTFLMAGLLTMARRKGLIVLLSFVIIVGAIVHSVRLLWDIPGLLGYDFIFSTLGLAGILGITLKMVFQDGTVTTHRIRGAVAAYLMLAALFGRVYAMIGYLDPGAFNISEALKGLRAEDLDGFLYFSVVSLTTLGFGDITPVTPIARSLVMAEAFIGQLYPAVLIARLVSLNVAAKEEK